MKSILAAVFLFFAAAFVNAAVPGVPDHAAAAVGHAAEAVHGLPLHPVEIGHIGPFPITNSILVTWIVALGLIGFAQYATRNIKRVPEGAQNFWEFLVESLYKFLENIIGHALVKKTFWFFATIFIFILFCNWVSLVPGVGTVGWGAKDAAGHFNLTEPFFRGANADLNMTFAMSMIFFVCWIIWALQANGRVADARKAIDAALAVGVKDSRLLYHAGAIAARAGDRATARRSLDEAARVNATSEVAADVERLRKRLG